MKVPLKWLDDFVTVELPVPELAERLTFAGLEVGEIIEVGREWAPDRILVGEITGVRPHPNADRLTLVAVDLGGGRTLEMVTGAPNITPGMSGEKVPVALAGASLRNPKGGKGATAVLKPSKIRGVKSEGMVCSQSELGISDEHEGIMILPGDAPVGAPLKDYLGDTVLDLELTPNLSYCLSLMGVAREVHALGAGRLRERDLEEAGEGEAAADLVEIEIIDSLRCPRYTAALVRGVTVGPSPFWMAYRLRLAGLRPVNNIVDITNYVMWETGQPLHAFDGDLLRGEEGRGRPKIVVRTAAEGEKIRTLDGVDRVCAAEDLLICDGKAPVAVAGVMGGEETEVHDGTRNVLIESAGFDRTSVRRTAARLRLHSEASTRFGRGVSPEGSPAAARRAAALMGRWAGGRVAAGIADCYPRPQEKVHLCISGREVERLLGIEVADAEMKKIFTDLGFGVGDEKGGVGVDIPPWRLDISIPADLVEEVARITGYDRIPAAPLPGGFPSPAPSPVMEAEEKLKDTLVDCGLTEVITYSLTRPEHSVRLGLDGEEGSFLQLANPLTADRTHLRRHLIPSLLETLKNNQRHVRRVAVFEVARVYHDKGGELPEEPRRLGILLWGPSEEPWWGNPAPPPFEFFHLKGIMETLGQRMGTGPLKFEASASRPYQPGRAAVVRMGETAVGTFGELDPAVRTHFDLPEGRIVLGEFDTGPLTADRGAMLHGTLSRYPVLYQDLALICPLEVEAEAVESALREAAGPLLVELRLFDLYRGDQIAEGKKSLAYSLVFQAPDRSLKEKEINTLRERILRRLKKELDIELRT